MLLKVLFAVGYGYALLGLASEWIPYLLSKVRAAPSGTGDAESSSPAPRFVVIAPCHNAADAIPRFIRSVRSQAYPIDRLKLILLIDNCSDDSAQAAARLGVEMRIRVNPERQGKGFALNEFFLTHLRHESFDAVALFDIDAEIEKDFLKKAAHRLAGGRWVIQGATVTKNPNISELASVGTLIQEIIRGHQEARAAAEWPPFLIGSHGIVFHRKVLDRLGWKISTGLTGDDMEFGIRCCLAGIPLCYATDLVVRNEVPSTFQSAKSQRRRWTATFLRLLPRYLTPLLKRSATDRQSRLYLLFNLLVPSFSNLMLLTTALAAVFSMIAVFQRTQVWEAVLALLAWSSHVLFLALALYERGCRISPASVRGAVIYLFCRSVALAESVLFVKSKRWWPTPH